jgi:DNA-binding transcriptional LysR family regulator
VEPLLHAMNLAPRDRNPGGLSREGFDRWNGLDVRHLAAFEAVATERSFHRAARRLRYAQSTISHQIASLERIIGTRLIERGAGPQPVRLTASGASLLPHVVAIRQCLEDARLAMSEAPDDTA